ncbi:TPA: hypothetical protein QDZ75_004314 [Stenotrophomonas maltophilia]|nr:hypothetical protein [Stenotrophomonas maltophilia]
MAKPRFDLSDPIVAQALAILAAQYPTSDEAHAEVLRGDFGGERIDPRDAVSAIVTAIRTAPEGYALADLDEQSVLPDVPTQLMLDEGWPDGEFIGDGFDKKGAYADLLARAYMQQENDNG